MLLFKVMVVLVFSTGAIQATNDRGFLYPFSINSQLQCFVQNAFAGSPDEPLVVPEVPPIIPLEETIRQGQVILLPQKSQFRMPSRAGLDEDELLKFLGSDFNAAITSTVLPDTDPPRACELLPSAVGSAGNQLRHVSMDQDPIPLLSNISAESAPTIRSIQDDLQVPFQILGDRQIETDHGLTRGIVFNQINNDDRLCDIWIAKCPLNTTWADISDSYFPQFVAQGVCSRKNCSFPRGQFCFEDLEYTALVTVLRWDCCFNFIANDAKKKEIRWDCGWRKVQIPLVCDCTCGCRSGI